MECDFYGFPKWQLPLAPSLADNANPVQISMRQAVQRHSDHFRHTQAGRIAKVQHCAVLPPVQGGRIWRIKKRLQLSVIKPVDQTTHTVLSLTLI